MSPAIRQWMSRAARQERKAPQWHVRRPAHQQAGPPPTTVRPPGGLLATLTSRGTGDGGGGGGGQNEGLRERGIKAANELSNSALRSAMLAVRQEGAILEKPVGSMGPGFAPRPPRYTQAQKGGNNHVPGRSPIAAMRNIIARPPVGGGGGGGTSGEDGSGNRHVPARPVPPPEGSASTSARHSRMGNGAPKWAGGVAMPPSQEQMARMAERAR